MCDISVSNTKINKYRKELFKNAPQCIPTCIIMVGGPCSGKSTIQKLCINELKYKQSDFIIIDSDIILTKFFNINYKCFKSDNPDITNAFTINIENFKLAAEGNYNIIYDTTGRNIKHIKNNIIPILHKHKYRIIVCINILDEKYAYKRCLIREKKTKRHMEQEYIHKAYTNLNKVIPKYINLKKNTIDSLLVYDNITNAMLIFEKTNNVYKCKNYTKVKKYFPNIACKICKMSFKCS